MLGRLVAAQGEEAPVRLPLPKLTVAVSDPRRLAPYADLIASELNVRKSRLTDDIDAYGGSS